MEEFTTAIKLQLKAASDAIKEPFDELEYRINAAERRKFNLTEFDQVIMMFKGMYNIDPIITNTVSLSLKGSSSSNRLVLKDINAVQRFCIQLSSGTPIDWNDDGIMIEDKQRKLTSELDEYSLRLQISTEETPEETDEFLQAIPWAQSCRSSGSLSFRSIRRRRGERFLGALSESIAGVLQ